MENNKNKMVMYVIHNLGVGGAETVVTNYLVGLKRLGINVCLLEINQSTSFLDKLLNENDIPVYYAYKKNSSSNLLFRILRSVNLRMTQRVRIQRIIDLVKPDIIHFHTNLYFLDKLTIDFKNCYYTFHTTVQRTINYPRPRFKHALRDSCKRGMTIIALSNEIKEEAMAVIGECNIAVIPNGIDIDAVRANRIDRLDFCQANHIPEDAFIVGHVGRFHPVKNHEKLISIFKEIYEREKESYLVLIGDGEQTRIDYIKGLVRKNGLERNTLFLGLRDDVTAIMSILDCFLFPSYAEGFPLSLAEAQIQGIRCVASDIVPDELLINDNCFKLNVDDSDSKWANYAMGGFVIKRSRDMSAIDIHTVLRKHMEEYFCKK